MEIHGLIELFFNLSLPVTTLGLLCFLLYTHWRSRRLFAVATISALVAFACLTVVLPLLYVAEGSRMLFQNASREIFYAWVIMVIYFVAEFRYRIRLLGSILMPVALVCMLLATFEENTPIHTTVDFDGIPTFVHMILVLASFGLLFLSGAAASMYLAKRRALKQHHPAAIDDELPALTTLKRLMVGTFRLAFPLFTVGLVLGSIYAGVKLPVGWYTHPFILAAAIVWLIHAVLFILHQTSKLDSRRLACGVIVLLVLVAVLVVFGSHRAMLEEPARAQLPPAEEGAP